MEFHVSLVGRRDLTGEIYRQLRKAIMDGVLGSGDQLPPSRELARRLNVSRTTVTVAYERLAAEGYVTSRVGAGTVVSFGSRAAVNNRRRRKPEIGRASCREIEQLLLVDVVWIYTK